MKQIYNMASNIGFLRSDLNYTEFHMLDGKKYMSSRTLLYHQKFLSSFIRVNRSHLVNPNFINNFEHFGEGDELILRNGYSIKIPRRKLLIFVKNINKIKLPSITNCYLVPSDT